MSNRGRAIVGIVVLAVIAAGATFGLMRRDAASAHGDPALAWMQTEFDLSAEQMNAMAEMHAAYSVVCDEHCQRIIDSRHELATLRTSGATPATIEAAAAEVARIDAACRRDLAKHVEQVATAIGGKQGDRYRAMILPKVAAFDHSAAPDLRLNPDHVHDGAAPHH